MSESVLEHVNITVSDPAKFAQTLCALFDWQVRWQGPSINDGKTVHVGGTNSYLALYSAGNPGAPQSNSYVTKAGLNHIGVVVDDLEAVEARVKEAGFVPTNHADYAPGRRFYFDCVEGIEFEVITYDAD